MIQYSPQMIEKKWQKIWSETDAFKTGTDYSRPKFYALIEFPYPSGDGLHVGHGRTYTAMDVVVRKKRMEGYNVLFPMGWDAFGLPTENYAIKHQIHPAVVTKRNVERFKRQMQDLGFSFDWSREVNTTDPSYYKWTQWIFLKLFENGLAYKAEIPINFCTQCKVGLANEEVVGGLCERCGSDVVQKRKSQWMLRISNYAQKLLDGLNTVDFLEKVETQQRNWIGRSEGAYIIFKTSEGQEIRVYTTRPDTVFGATYMVLSPEHPLIDENKGVIKNFVEVETYRDAVARKSDFERTEINKEKTGVELCGLTAINPATGKHIPVWTSDYVLMSYGTGAIMAVPGHDTRDYEFAKKFNMPIVEVISGGNIGEEAYTDIDGGKLVNSGFLNDMSVAEAKRTIIEWLEKNGLGEAKTNYKLRDWVFSRQRYWGEPIPIVICDDCGFVPLKESDLPLTLPDVEAFIPSDTGESPLAVMTGWVNTVCPKCGRPAKRETDTMPQWAGSSWYFLRYIDPSNDSELASKALQSYWMPVDWYNGGMEHTTLHLLYSRFWHKFLYDIDVVTTPEPYKKRTSQGMVLGEDGQKMSKSRGNVINPDDVVKQIGVDAFRVYEMFMGAFDQAIPWSEKNAQGCWRFLDRVFRLLPIVQGGESISKDLMHDVHSTIKKVTEDIEAMKFNTAIAQLMTLLNCFHKKGQITRRELQLFLLLLNPFAPHIAAEMWEIAGLGGTMLSWPEWDESALVLDTVEIAVQINGKIRARIMVPPDITEDDIKSVVNENERVAVELGEKSIRKFIFIPGRLVNIVAG